MKLLILLAFVATAVQAMPPPDETMLCELDNQAKVMHKQQTTIYIYTAL